MDYLTTCEICKRVETGVTNLLEDYFIKCESKHLICINHIEEVYNLNFIKQEIINKLKILFRYKDYSSEDFSFIKAESIYDILSGSELSDDFQIPISICPVCQFKSVSNLDLERYKEIIFRKNNRELEEEIKRKFESYEDFKKYLIRNKSKSINIS